MALIRAALTDGDYGMDITDADGHTLRMDIPVSQGGLGSGFRPMQTLLAALAGCSSVDIVMILKKQKQDFQGLEIEVDGEREEGKEPSLWRMINLKFLISGNVDPQKAQRAVELSMQKYCSVAETLRKAGAEIHYAVYVNNVPV
ncbi:MAG: OsmC family protein [Chitinophagaceae bacterium]|jgi:putative redox protein